MLIQYKMKSSVINTKFRCVLLGVTGEAGSFYRADKSAVQTFIAPTANVTAHSLDKRHTHVVSL